MTAAEFFAKSDCPQAPHGKGGPRTAEGKAVSARNATSHGLFSRDVVLPSLGEDPEGYRQMEAEWIAQLAPRNLLERLYVEKIAAASWRLRRLNRWQAQLFEDETLTEDERLNKLDKVLRHETALHRQIDTSVKMLNKDVPQLHKGRARDRALLDTMQTELDCREHRENALEVEFEAREQLKKMEQAAAASALDYARLDATQNTTLNCQNEPASRAAAAPPPPAPLSTEQLHPTCGEGPGVGASSGLGNSSPYAVTNCQNEPTPVPSPALSESDTQVMPSEAYSPRIGGGGVIPTDFGILLAPQLRRGRARGSPDLAGNAPLFPE